MVRCLEIDGCINCSVYKSFRKDEIQLHEAMVSCLLLGCMDLGYATLKPYIGSHELIEYWEKNRETIQPEILENIIRILTERKARIPVELIEANPKVKETTVE